MNDIPMPLAAGQTVQRINYQIQTRTWLLKKGKELALLAHNEKNT